jgi:hypothetical protein
VSTARLQRSIVGLALAAAGTFVTLTSLRALGAPAAPAVQTLAAEDLWLSPADSAFDYATKPAPSATAELFSEWPRLVDGDEVWEPKASPLHLPSSCLEIGDHACVACFTKAYASIDFVHATLERLRAIYGATKAMSDQAIEVGDRLAPTLGAGEGEWQHQRSEIVQSMVDLRGTYRTKYTDLLKTLATALASIDRCELLVHGEARWYERYGAGFAESVQNTYRMND